jgi:hypothetical protein
MNPKWLENNILEMKASIEELRELIKVVVKTPPTNKKK